MNMGPEVIKKAVAAGWIRLPVALAAPKRGRGLLKGTVLPGPHWRQIGERVGISATYAQGIYQGRRQAKKVRGAVLAAVAELGEPMRRRKAA